MEMILQMPNQGNGINCLSTYNKPVKNDEEAGLVNAIKIMFQEIIFFVYFQKKDALRYDSKR